MSKDVAVTNSDAFAIATSKMLTSKDHGSIILFENRRSTVIITE